MKSLFINDALSKSQADEIIRVTLELSTAGANVNTARWRPLSRPPQYLAEGGTGGALTTITQAAVNDLLRDVNGNATVNDVIVATAFGSTAMVDNDTYAWVLNCEGQISSIHGIFHAEANIGTPTPLTGIVTSTALTNATFTGAQVYLTPAGNLAGRVTFTNISAHTSAGTLTFDIPVWFK